MATMDNILFALRQMTENLNKLATAQGMTGGAERDANSGRWDGVERYNNVNMFSGNQADWEEFSLKLKCQVGAGSAAAVKVLDTVVDDMVESQVEKAAWDPEMGGSIKFVEDVSNK